MDKYISKHLLRDNCDAIEKVGYTRTFSPDELTDRKEQLADTSIKINDIEEEFKEVKTDFKERLKPLEETKSKLLTELKNKSEYVTEDCYKFIDHDSRMVGFYNTEGELVSSRQIMSKELQKNIFHPLKTGTENE